MAEIKLLSIKRNEEASYFYENKDSTTLDSNRNEVVGVQENHKAPQISKKARKEDERRSKKEEKQKRKETKQREKERKKSLKNSRKEVVGSVDTVRSSDGDVKSNGGLQVGMDVGEAAENKDEESLNAHEEDRNENEESGEEHDVTGHEHEEVSNQGEDLSKEHEGVSSEHESSIKVNESTHVEITAHATSSEEPGVSGETHATSNDRHADRELSSENCVEETITADSVETTEESPKEFSQQPKINPDIPEPTGGEHLEIEISDVTDLDADASSSNQVIVVQNSFQTSTYPSSAASEGQILVATVQQVESGVDLDSIFAECNAPTDEEDKEEKRKSVRFQEETEEIGHGDVESEDHEHASINLGGDFAGTTDDDSVERPQTLEPSVEVVNKEEESKVESCVDLDHVFAPSEQKANDIKTAPEETDHVGAGKVNGSAKVNGNVNLSNSGTKTDDDLVQIRLNESNEHTNTTTKKKEKRKRNRFSRCCFP